MMKLATIAAAAFLLSGEAIAAKVGRNRKVNIYSSNSEFGRETVDPYLGFPDEREQRSLQEGSVELEMSIPAATGSVATGSVALENISSWNTSAVTTMRAMFEEASSFNQNLCAWRDKFPYSDMLFYYVFMGSGCAFQSDPAICDQGPFCASDCTNS
jgi:hypothetical protein